MDTLRILLIEDDPDDVELLQEALYESRVPHDLHVIMDGEKVVDYLKNQLLLPDIIVLDFNLPKLHGKALLTLIRSVDRLARIPLVVLTTSASPLDIQYAQDHGASKYLTKPSTMSGFSATVEAIVAVGRR